MYARIAWSKLPPGGSMEAAVNNVREQILPSFQTLDGYLGTALLGNRDSGEGVSATYWQTQEALAASEAMGSAARAQATQATGGSIDDVDRFELMLNDRAAPAKVGSAVRSNDVVAPLAQVDATIAFIRDTAIPAARQLSGYQSTRVWLNRQTGRVIATTSWATAADRQASEAVMGQMRRQAADMAHTERPTRVSLYEVALLDLSPAMEEAVTAATHTQ